MYDGSSLGWYLPISSMTRPSRFLRESTTTMRYCGTRILPRRSKRILTATSVVSPCEWKMMRSPQTRWGPGRTSSGGAPTTGIEGPSAGATQRDIVPEQGYGAQSGIERTGGPASLGPRTLPHQAVERRRPTTGDLVDGQPVPVLLPAERGRAVGTGC